jgi:Glycosyl hydrolase family 45
MPCTDKQNPDHAGEPCSIWVAYDETKGPGEAKDCDASWLTGSGYCLKSCGKCSDGTGGSGGSGGSAGGFSTGLGPGPTLPDVTNGNVYWASRYWDCCKPHCSQQGLPSCGSNGVSQDGGNSACSGGSAYACYNQAPRFIGDNVSYGYVAVPNPSCGTCYHLQFTGTGKFNANDPGSKAIAGKHMIVKVANSGGDVAGNQFDLAVPGGGVGLNANTCTAQWKLSSNDLGPTAGGFLAACSGTHDQKMSCVRDKCNKLPDGDARKGCMWFVDWFQVADDPNFRYEPIACPSDI